MKKYIVILRGINVGGKRKLKMADLRESLSKAGYTDISTYIQSGNVILTSALPAEDIANNVHSIIEKEYGYDVPTIVRSVDEWHSSADTNPFLAEGMEDISKLHLTCLSEVPSEEALEAISAYDYSPDLFRIMDKNVYIYCEDKYHKSKLTNGFFESKLKVQATTRNWKTVLKLKELTSEA